VSGLDDFAHRDRPHYIAHRDRRRIVRRIVYPAAHGRIDREIAVADQDFSFNDVRNPPGVDIEKFRSRYADWSVI
tara:strand:- start:1746 stop:1970 length:225 start_codon:yes stop_codon:yes gene_type:complete